MKILITTENFVTIRLYSKLWPSVDFYFLEKLNFLQNSKKFLNIAENLEIVSSWRNLNYIDIISIYGTRKRMPACFRQLTMRR